MPRRKPGTLLPIETDILQAALSTRRSGQPTFHGFALAESLREQSDSKALTAHGTLYKALGRLEELGLLSSSWEDPATAEGRPRRRLYELTERGAQVAERLLAERTAQPAGRVPGERSRAGGEAVPDRAGAVGRSPRLALEPAPRAASELA